MWAAERHPFPKFVQIYTIFSGFANIFPRVQDMNLKIQAIRTIKNKFNRLYQNDLIYNNVCTPR